VQGGLDGVRGTATVTSAAQWPCCCGCELCDIAAAAVPAAAWCFLLLLLLRGVFCCCCCCCCQASCVGGVPCAADVRVHWLAGTRQELRGGGAREGVGREGRWAGLRARLKQKQQECLAGSSVFVCVLSESGVWRALYLIGDVTYGCRRWKTGRAWLLTCCISFICSCHLGCRRDRLSFWNVTGKHIAAAAAQ